MNKKSKFPVAVCSLNSCVPVVISCSFSVSGISYRGTGTSWIPHVCITVCVCVCLSVCLWSKIWRQLKLAPNLFDRSC